MNRRPFGYKPKGFFICLFFILFTFPPPPLPPPKADPPMEEKADPPPSLNTFSVNGGRAGAVWTVKKVRVHFLSSVRKDGSALG